MLVPLVLVALVAGVPAPAGRAAESCGGCHGTAVGDWRASAHADAWTSPLFRAGLKVEPKAFCVGCHAPQAVRAEEGIGCVTCHEAQKGARGPARPRTGHAVALRTGDELRDPAFCRDCHEFATPAFEGGRIRTTELPMQSTFSEWLAYQRAGGAETCQSCHMPGGRHVMTGTRDLELLRRALAVTVVEVPSGGTLTLASAGVGHRFPTGDLFRHLTVEVRAAGEEGHEDDDAWRVVDRVGRTFETRLKGSTLLAQKVETANTSLVPGAPRVVALPAGEGPLSWRVRYHYGSERDEERGFVPADALVATLAEGRIARERVPPGFVDLADVTPGVVIDVRYARADNFIGRVVRGYGDARCLLTKEAAGALAKVESALEPRGLRLHVYDCYRPQRAVDDFVAWARARPAGARTPAHNPVVPAGELFARGYIAASSSHSRGSTVDVTLVSAASGLAGEKPDAVPSGRDCHDLSGEFAPDGTLSMGTTFDCFDERSNVGAAGVSAEARRNRQVLREAMEKAGFAPYAKEWWHFTLAREPFPDTIFDFEIASRVTRP